MTARHETWAMLVPTLQRRSSGRAWDIGVKLGWLIALATEMNAQQGLVPFKPCVSRGCIRILHPDKGDMFYCLSTGPDSFTINAVWPKAGTDNVWGSERETIFEGDAKSCADFAARLVAQVEVASAGSEPE
jgi:hypothetical protein